MRKVMRVHSLAKQNQVPSKYLLDLLKLTGSNVKSASSVVYIDETNKVYFDTVIARAQSNYIFEDLLK